MVESMYEEFRPCGSSELHLGHLPLTDTTIEARAVACAMSDASAPDSRRLAASVTIAETDTGDG